MEFQFGHLSYILDIYFAYVSQITRSEHINWINYVYAPGYDSQLANDRQRCQYVPNQGYDHASL